MNVSVLHFLLSVHVLYNYVDEPTKKKRRSRWASEDTRTVIPGLPTVLPSNLSEAQQKLYLCTLSDVVICTYTWTFWKIFVFNLCKNAIF